MSEKNRNDDVKKLTGEVKTLGREIRKLTNAIQKATEPETVQTMHFNDGTEIELHQGQEPIITMTARAAVDTLRSICRDAEDCGREGCPIFDWCEVNLPENSPKTAPIHWGDM